MDSYREYRQVDGRFRHKAVIDSHFNGPGTGVAALIHYDKGDGILAVIPAFLSIPFIYSVYHISAFAGFGVEDFFT